ncbi:MAG: hypothetical protein ACRC6V_06610 [Bacteroidales bacterium]
MTTRRNVLSEPGTCDKPRKVLAPAPRGIRGPAFSLKPVKALPTPQEILEFRAKAAPKPVPTVREKVIAYAKQAIAEGKKAEAECKKKYGMTMLQKIVHDENRIQNLKREFKEKSGISYDDYVKGIRP